MPALASLAFDPGPIPHLATTPVVFRRILAAIDFSPHTSEVIRTAVQIARQFDAEIYLVNAATPTPFGTGAEPIPIETFEVNLAVARARMEALVQSEPLLATLKHQEVVAYAGVLDLVRQVVEDREIDLVITGSHGATGMERLALGSIAESILRCVRCPVLITGPQCQPQKNIFASILLATRLKPSTLRSAQYATSLAEFAHGKLTLLHVVDPTRKTRSIQPELLHSYLMQELQELVPGDFSVSATAEPRVEYGRAAELIRSVALCTRASLIVMGAREEAPFADHSPISTIAEILHRSVCPVLTVRGHFR